MSTNHQNNLPSRPLRSDEAPGPADDPVPAEDPFRPGRAAEGKRAGPGKKAKRRAEEARPLPAEEAEPKKGKKKDKKGKKKEAIGTFRGIETMFRTSYQQHVALSGLADNKSNIMISINGIIISIIIASISPKIDANPWLLIPTSVLLLSCLVSMVYAILSARPRIKSRIIDLEEVRQNRANLLFFGNFVNLPEDQYLEGMTELLQNPEQLYRSMIQDIYGLGQVLTRKFRLLQVSYTAFMIGLALGVVLYIGVYVGVVAFTPDVATQVGTMGTGTP